MHVYCVWCAKCILCTYLQFNNDKCVFGIEHIKVLFHTDLTTLVYEHVYSKEHHKDYCYTG